MLTKNTSKGVFDDDVKGVGGESGVLHGIWCVSEDDHSGRILGSGSKLRTAPLLIDVINAVPAHRCNLAHTHTQTLGCVSASMHNSLD